MMLRRNAILLACSAIPTISLASVVHRDDDELPVTADDLARMEYRSIQDSHPDDWQRMNYVSSVTISSEYAAILCVTNDPRLLDLWAARVDRAMYPGRLRVHDVGKAGPMQGRDAGYNHVTLMIVGRESLELERSAFTDLLAKYPENALTC